MEERQGKMLVAIISEYIKKATPVASNFLAGRGRFKLSSATIRNEMAALEEAGYICQPHTSAGRIPTELGYKFYLSSLDLEKNKLSEEDKKLLDAAVKTKEAPQKKLAKALAEISCEAVILAVGPRDIYYTGLSNLFSKPEFKDQNLICRLGEVVDHLDEKIDNIFEKIKDDFEVMLGEDNPLDGGCATVVSKCKNKNGKIIMAAILGSMRMDYARNMALIKYAGELLKDLNI